MRLLVVLTLVVACGGAPTRPPVPQDADDAGNRPPECPPFHQPVCVASGGTGGGCMGYACVATGGCAVDGDCAEGLVCACSGVGERLCGDDTPACVEASCGSRSCVPPGSSPLPLP